VIVGGGVVGASVAWHLAGQQAGEVVLCERDRLGSGTTWHSAGNVTWKPLGDHDEPVRYLLDTLEPLERESGRDLGWVRTGRLFLARGPETLAALSRLAEAAAEDGCESRLLGPRQAAALHPLLDPGPLAGAWYNARAGRLDPAGLTDAYARAARRRGARVLEQCAVQGIDVRAGAAVGVRASQGALEARHIVICAGLWSRDLLVEIGDAPAQGTCEHFYVIARVPTRLPRDTPTFVIPDDLVYGREEVGDLLVGCFDEGAWLVAPSDLPDPFSFALLEPDWDQAAPYLTRAAEVFPALRDAPIRRFVNGPESFTPDGEPLVGTVVGIDGLHVACAMNSLGVTLSAAVGRAVAGLVRDGDPGPAARDWSPARFGERARDPAWLDGAIRAAPSRLYRAANAV
jgi:4-methylaminobutanoate oxidase (formaldehyde-forming)